MAAPQDRNGGDIVPVFVPFDNNRELSLSFHEAILPRRKPDPSGVVQTGLVLESVASGLVEKGFFSATVLLGITLTRRYNWTRDY